MRKLTTTITVITPIALAAALILGLNDTAAASTIESAATSGAPWLLGAGLVGLLGLHSAFQR